MTRHTESVEVVVKAQRRMRWSLAEKAALMYRSYEPGMSVSLVARQEGVSAGLLLQWRKLERQGALTAVSAGEAVVPALEGLADRVGRMAERSEDFVLAADGHAADAALMRDAWPTVSS